jgi:hypothetical protein
MLKGCGDLIKLPSIHRIQLLVDPAREQEFFVFEAPDKQRLQSFPAKPVCANDKFLAQLQRQFDQWEPNATINPLRQVDSI